MRVLGIETSCDETAVAIVDSDRRILAQKILSQTADHAPFGGVVPEIAARAHIHHLERLTHEALQECKFTMKDIDGIAVTAGPGLIGGLIVGVMTAKGIASAANKPCIAVNHLEGHALTARLTHHIAFPFLLLLVSGGHCQILLVRGIGNYTRIGTTIDDAIGEAFDKVAKMLNIPYPGGPEVEKRALDGNPKAFQFPRPLIDRPHCDFSLAGLKTAVLRTKQQLEEKAPLTDQQVADICASFQQAVTDIIENRLMNAIAEVKKLCPENRRLVVSGGVAANKAIRATLEALSERNGLEFTAPPLNLCTDNAAMIAWVGLERLQNHEADALDFVPRARWPLDPKAVTR
ncbi:MAG: tRNA (adenosine(37)-N6)-threonylcarbamoyltransferase complex transferase subunit TsaD [Proteobacteria bacterium]|nr:tRNA (adenosine(37)-N6)-threonylcarbamoyltransferase complex transferase subunit TsaD [Pseudomonadota bacterium]